MSTDAVVAVLHGEHTPRRDILDRVEAHASLRLTAATTLRDALPGADVLFLYDFFNPSLSEAWHSADRLRWVHVAAAGVDAILFDELVASDVTVTNSRGVFDRPIAEYVLAQMLSFAKGLPVSRRLQERELWRHREVERLAGTRAVIIGTGAIGRAIARLLTAVGVEVAGSGRHARSDPDFGRVSAPEQLPETLAAADWVVVAAPLTDATRGMLDARALAALPPHARLINIARGEIVDTEALTEALASGQLAGAALDVTDPEPLPASHPLWGMDNVALTPHHSGDFVGWRDALTELFADNFERWRHGQPLLNVVDKSLGYVPSKGASHEPR